LLELGDRGEVLARVTDEGVVHGTRGAPSLSLS
jgi:hypothetical protein